MSAGQKAAVEMEVSFRVVLHREGTKDDPSQEALIYVKVFSGADLLVWVKGYSPDGAGILRNDNFPLLADTAELLLVSLAHDRGWDFLNFPESCPCAIAIKSACRNHPAWQALDAARGVSDPRQPDAYRGLRRVYQELQAKLRGAQEKCEEKCEALRQQASEAEQKRDIWEQKVLVAESELEALRDQLVDVQKKLADTDGETLVAVCRQGEDELGKILQQFKARLAEVEKLKMVGTAFVAEVHQLMGAIALSRPAK